jgi:hypothetical protein
MRMSITLPVAAALAAAIGLSGLTSAQAKGKTIAQCLSESRACANHCAPYTGEFRRGCMNRCGIGLRQCGGDVATGHRVVKPGGGVLSASTASQPTPKGPVLGGSTGTNGGGKPVVKPITRR